MNDRNTLPTLLYSPDQCAKALNLSRSTVYALIRLGDLPAIRLRGTGKGSRPMYRIEPKELEAFVARERQRTALQRTRAIQR